VLLKIVSDPFFLFPVSVVHDCVVGHAIYPIELLYSKADYKNGLAHSVYKSCDDSLSSFKPRNVCLNTVARDYDFL